MSEPQTTAAELSRAAGKGRPAAPVRLAHLGLGNFFRAHQAWYTDRAPDADDWGIAAFTGRRGDLADALTAQEGLYTLIIRAADGDRFDVLSSLSRAHPGADHEAWLGYLASPEVRAVIPGQQEHDRVEVQDGRAQERGRRQQQLPRGADHVPAEAHAGHHDERQGGELARNFRKHAADGEDETLTSPRRWPPWRSYHVGVADHLPAAGAGRERRSRAGRRERS